MYKRMASKSHTYVQGKNEKGLPEYYVDVTEEHLFKFELYNSLCSNDAYDLAIYLCEQALNRGEIPILPSEVITLLVTLASVGSLNEEIVTMRGDPFNPGRSPLPSRSLRLLNRLYEIVNDFDTERYPIHDLELLRCQFFHFVDRITARKGRSLISESPVKRSVAKHLRGNTVLDLPIFEEGIAQESKEMYSSYINLMDIHTQVLKTTMINKVLSQAGALWNCIGWALSASMKDDGAEYISGRKWLSIIQLLLQLYDIRQEYYMNFEMRLVMHENTCDPVCALKRSPMFRFFDALDCRNIFQGLVDYIFVDCITRNSLHPISPFLHELSSVNADNYLYKETQDSKLATTMNTRRYILYLFFKFLDQAEQHTKLASLEINRSDCYKYMVDTLYVYTPIKDFRHFFLTRNIAFDFNLLSVLIELHLKRALDNLRLNNGINILGSINDVNHFSKEFLRLINITANSNLLNRVRSSERRMQVDHCIIVLARLATFLHGTKQFKSLPNFKAVIKTKINTQPGLNDLLYIFKIK